MKFGVRWIIKPCFPFSSVSKESACCAGDPGSIPGSGRSPGEGNGTPLQDACLENLMDRGGWWAAVHGVAKSQARLSDWHNATIYLSLHKWTFEEEMATSSRILAWRIAWIEEPGSLQSRGSQRVRHNWMTNTTTTNELDWVALYLWRKYKKGLSC